MHWVFDVDGTLTPSRSKMDSEFAAWFENFATHNAVYLVTGSDREKTLEQIPYDIYCLCVRVYQCSGNEVWEQDRLIRSNDIEITEELQRIFDYWIKASQFGYKRGNHVDKRSGLVNFSVLGRPASAFDRNAYISWDEVTEERKTIAWCLNDAFGDQYNFQIAGETGIDITKKGFGKEQILKDFDGSVTFYGDTIKDGGNDYDLAVAINYGLEGFQHEDSSKAIKVDDWKHTWELLKK
tara:strand:- start:1005 stop:1718 length:714 start_codon:yes stop_codon:yes gene_type:complete